MSTKTPLALFVYNRPSHTLRILNAILRLDRLNEVALFVFSDAAKTIRASSEVEEVRALIKNFINVCPIEVTVIERLTNFGLAKSISDGVSDLAKKFGRVIVLEDDLVPSQDFLNFMLEGLEKYKTAKNVFQISGCLLAETLHVKSDGVFLPLTTTWGWATWDHAWKQFRELTSRDRKLLDEDYNFRHRFSAEGAVNYVSMLDDRLAGRNDSWGIFWWFQVARNNGLVLYPRTSLIWNGGFDASGVHCGGGLEYSDHPPDEFYGRRLPEKLKFPAEPIVDADAWDATLNYFKGDFSSDPIRNRFCLKLMLKRVKLFFRKSTGRG